MTKILCEFCNNILDIKKYYFLCNNCNKLTQLPDKIDYFTYLNIELGYPIDQNLLEAQYIKLFSLYHPDNFVNSNNKEQLNSITHSSYLNTVYSVLKDNTKLVQYLYELNTGNNLDLNKENCKNIATIFFDLNEELENLNNQEQKVCFKNKINNIYNDLIAQISIAFKNKDYIKIQNELFNQLKYIHSIQYRLQ